MEQSASGERNRMFRGQLLPFTALIVALCGQGHGRAALLHAQVPGHTHTAARATLLSGTLDALRHPRSSPARVLWRLRGGQQSNSTAPVGGGGGEWERWEAALNQRAGRRQGVGDLARVHGVPGPRGSLSSSAGDLGLGAGRGAQRPRGGDRGWMGPKRYAQDLRSQGGWFEGQGCKRARPGGVGDQEVDDIASDDDEEEAQGGVLGPIKGEEDLAPIDEDDPEEKEGPEEDEERERLRAMLRRAAQEHPDFEHQRLLAEEAEAEAMARFLPRTVLVVSRVNSSNAVLTQ